jgi:hypothetical protein
MRAPWDEAKALPRPHGTTHSKSAANGAPAPKAGAPDKDRARSVSDVISERGRKICDMVGVREYGEGDAVQLWQRASGRLVIVATNEAEICGTEVDLYDLTDWVQAGPGRGMVLDNGSDSLGTDGDLSRDRQGA